MSDLIVMPKRLTAENGGKSLMIGEFFETIYNPCPYEVCTPDDCPICGGFGQVSVNVPISWITIKEIYAKAADHFGEPFETSGSLPAHSGNCKPESQPTKQ